MLINHLPRPSATHSASTVSSGPPGQTSAHSASGTIDASANVGGVAPCFSGRPRPLGRPYGKVAASTTIVQRPSVGASNRLSARVATGRASILATLSSTTQTRPTTPKAPVRGSRMISSRRSGVAWPKMASHVSIRPSACRAPVRTSNSVTSSALPTSGETLIKRKPMSTKARIPPSSSPTKGNHATAVSSRTSDAGAGRRVRNAMALHNPLTNRDYLLMTLAQADRLHPQHAHAFPPVAQQVGHRLVERDDRLPSRRRLELVDVRPQQTDVAGPHTRRVLLLLDLRIGVRQQDIEHLANRHARAAADVVDLARLAALRGQPAGAHHVPRIGPVATRVQVTDFDDRWADLSLDLGDLFGEAAGGEDLAAPRAGVVEAARYDASEAIAAEVLDGQHLLPNLAHRVRAERAERIALLDRRFVGVHQPVLLTRAGDVDHRVESRLAHRLEQVDLRRDVVGEGSRGRGPAGGHEALRGEMEDAVRLDGADHAADGAAVLQLAVDYRHLAALDEAAQAGLIGDALPLVENVEQLTRAQVLQVVELAAPAERAKDLDVWVMLGQVLGQEAAGHPGDAGDQDAHFFSQAPFMR